jgi:hypothetical protein
VSGAVFIAARSYILARFKPGTLHAMARELSQEHAAALVDPKVDVWYPEAALLTLMRVCCHRLANEELNRYHALVYDVALFAMRYAFREAMDLGGASQALAKFPSLWRRLQHGAREFRICELHAGAFVSVSECPGCTDQLYRQSVVAILQALLYAASGAECSLTVVGHSTGRIEMRVGGLSS